jgi:hypothetical protein
MQRSAIKTRPSALSAHEHTKRRICIRVGYALISATAVNQPAGRRKSGTRSGPAAGGGCSIRTVQGGTVTERGGSVERLWVGRHFGGQGSRPRYGPLSAAGQD